MPTTYEPIATTTLASAAASFSFLNIPGTYTDLRLVIVALSNSTNNTSRVTFNGVTSGNLYSSSQIYGNGSTDASQEVITTDNFDISQSGFFSSTYPSLDIFDIFDYAGSKFKHAIRTVCGDRGTAGGVEYHFCLFRSTSALTSITATGSNTSYAAGTTATLYGITKA